MRVLMVFMLALLVVGPGWTATAATRDLGREVLAPNDGWAAATTGTNGGAPADASHVFTVTNRQELIAALNNLDPTPKIIYVSGTIDANVDDANQPLSCADYARDGYTLEAYLATFDPAVWGTASVPSGPLEAARIASQRAQQARIQIPVGSNTTIVGLGKKGRLRGAWLSIRNADNVIVRNLTFQDTYDCFPQWDPTDGSTGNWNSMYDYISVRTSTHVWIDHNDFSDANRPDSGQPLYFGRLYQVHDGEVDITHASDYVTVSWNRFTDHDKVMLIGSSDSGSTAANDRGKLRVTVHHNLFDNVGQRAPRVRFGQVHVYNNYYRIYNPNDYIYSWGAGIESQIYAENNMFKASDGITPDRLISVFKGTTLRETGTYFNGTPAKHLVDVVGAYNAVNDPDLANSASWTPTLFTAIDPTPAVPAKVMNLAGPFIAE